MGLDEYQLWTREVAKYPPENELQYLTAGLCAEAGEVADKVAKHWRGDKELDKDAVIKEVADVMWLCVRLCDHFEVSAEEAIKDNVNKLMSRLQRGVIKGSGDDR